MCKTCQLLQICDTNPDGFEYTDVAELCLCLLSTCTVSLNSFFCTPLHRRFPIAFQGPPLCPFDRLRVLSQTQTRSAAQRFTLGLSYYLQQTVNNYHLVDRLKLCSSSLSSPDQWPRCLSAHPVTRVVSPGQPC